MATPAAASSPVSDSAPGVKRWAVSPGPQPERVPAPRRHVEVEPRAEVADARAVADAGRRRVQAAPPLLDVHAHVEGVVAGRERERAERAGRERARVAERAGEVAPVEAAAVDVLPRDARALAKAVLVGVDRLEPEHVGAAVEAEVDAVAVRRPPVQLRVEVVEVGARLDLLAAPLALAPVLGLDERPRDEVDVGPPAAHQERRLARHDRPLGQQPRGQDADLPLHAPLLQVPVPQPHVEDRPEAPAEPGGVRPLRQLDAAHGVAVERGQEAEQVRGVVDRDAVQEQERLVRRPAADVEPGRPLLAAPHAGQQLDRLEHVGLAQEGGEAADVAAGERHLPHLRRRLGPRADVAVVGLDDDLAERVGAPERHVEPCVGRPAHDALGRRVAHVRHDDPRAVGREREAEEPVGVRRDADADARRVDRRSDQHLPALGVADGPAHDDRRRRLRGGGADGEREARGEREGADHSGGGAARNQTGTGRFAPGGAGRS